MSRIVLEDQDRKILTEILVGLPPRVEVIAFGSRVRGNARKFSDLDLCLKNSAEVSEEDLSRLKECFQESNLSIKIDLSRYEELPASFQETIDSEGERIPR